MGESGTADAALAGAAYLEHLGDADLRLLVSGTEDVAAAVMALRAQPQAVTGLLGAACIFDTVFGPAGRSDAFLRASPFLVFAVAVHRVADELRAAPFLVERVGGRQRLPMFDVDRLRVFLSDPLRRLFLIELLASYTHVASGSTLVKSRGCWRRQRFSELDPLRMAALLDVVPESEQPGVYRRLGDLALFLTGVFPDHNDVWPLHPIARERLVRIGRQWGDEPSDDVASGGLLEQLGSRWYRAASRTAPPPLTGTMRVVSEVADQFGVSRRILNLVTDRYLFPHRGDLFPSPN